MNYSVRYTFDANFRRADGTIRRLDGSFVITAVDQQTAEQLGRKLLPVYLSKSGRPKGEFSEVV